MDPEDEVFNEIERKSKVKQWSIRAAMLKPKTAEEFYSELMDKARDEVRNEIDYLKRNFKKPWVELTDEQMLECNMDGDFVVDREIAKLNVQAKLKEKNT
jgi:diacylglycerol kinase family enzyme